ncbi:MAG: pre-peptidase C-terminal domain-containing protein, partial [Anaerolineae bacterium]
PLNEAQPISADTSSDVHDGAVIDITGDPLGLLDSGGDELRARLLLFLSESDSSAQDGRTAPLILFSARADQWETHQYGEIVVQMATTIIIHDIQTGYTLSGGSANVQGSLINGHVLDGELAAGIKDVWTFTVDEASYVTLSLAPADKELDLTLTLISPYGQTIAQIDSGYAGNTEVAADLYLTENGRYVVEVSDFFGLSGQYSLSLTIEAKPQYTDTGEIQPGEAIESELPVNAQHVWSFGGEAGNLVSIDLSPRDNQMDAILNLYGPDGSRLVALDEGFSGDPEVISGFELPVTGQYAIHVSSFADNGGRYALTLDEGGEATKNFYDAGDLLYGDKKSESLNSNEAHAWFFQGRPGDQVHIVVRPLDDILDLEVWLFDPEVNRLTAKDEFAAGDTETIEFTLPQEGQYLILVREFFGEAGNYEIELSATPAPAPELAGRINYGEPVNGTLAPQQMALWSFNGDEGDVLDFELTPGSDSEDVVLILQDPQGNTVWEIDDAPAGQSETLYGFTIPADGQWALVVKSFFAEAGTYSLSVQRTQ